MAEPLAYFLTWTTYGTRLHGDPRGTVDRDHNQPGAPLLAPDAARMTRVRSLMSHPVFTLTRVARREVDASVRDKAAFRGWLVHALSVRSNHVHVVIACGHRDGAPEASRVMQELKAWATRGLRARGIVAAGRPVWTAHGSMRRVRTSAGLARAIDYVERMQALKG